MYLQIVLDWAREQGVDVTPQQLEQLARHKAMVLETNKVMNLTAITEPQDFDVKHIVDSLTLVPYVKDVKTLGDIGTGAGFPGLVLGIMCSHLQVTLVDSLGKRVRFLQEVVDALGLTNVECIHSRGEELKGRTFDVCTARAVANMSKLAKWVLPLVKAGGTFLAMKGPDVAEELEKAAPIITKYGGTVRDVALVPLPMGLQHSIIVVKK